MHRNIPRLVIAGTGSGCGKTTVACGILQALVNRGLKPGALKCGPDYIDPMFHSRIIGAAASNLDLFFFGRQRARAVLCRRAAGLDITIIEGVMGYYDGLGLDSSRASTWEAASVTESPAVLVVNARGMSRSVLAVIEGYLGLEPDSRIRGVILNNCTAMTYPSLEKAIRQRFGGRVIPLGYLPVLPACRLESRHLGLVTAREVEDLREKMQLLAAQVEKSIDLEALLALARSAPDLPKEELALPPAGESFRLAVARDQAFCFYYEDSLDILRQLGAQIVEFSPLEDETLPEGISGLYLGGGYPELYAPGLSENRTMRASIRRALEQGLPCIAECGGFMYLTQAIGAYPMVGALPGTCYDTGKLTRFGYVTLTAEQDGLLCRAGQTIAAHEFHHWDCTEPGSGFTARKISGKSWRCGVVNDHLYAGFPHFHFAANPDFAVRFCQACVQEGKHND